MTVAGTPEHDLLHSGSRWEPAAEGGLPTPPQPLPAAGPPPGPRRSRRGRRALVAVAGVGCLLLGGVGGYLLGHVAGAPGSGSPTPAGSTGGIPGTGFGGPGDGDGDGGFRHHGFPGGPQDGTGSGTTGGTGTGTGVGSTGGTGGDV